MCECKGSTIGIVMIQVMRSSSSPAQRRRIGDGELSVVMDPATQQLLKYEDVRSSSSRGGQAGGGAGGAGEVTTNYRSHYHDHEMSSRGMRCNCHHLHYCL